MERNYKLPREGGLEPGADPEDIIRRFEKIHTNIFENEAAGSQYVAEEIAACIREKQSEGEMCVLGMTTGKSPVGLFRAMVDLHKQGLSFSNVILFSLDEFFPIAPEELQSRNYSMHENLLDHIDIKPETIHIPDGTLPQNKVSAFCHDYENLIEEFDGIDLMVLGTGVQGQIGFNEAGSSEKSRTRTVLLSYKSRKAQARNFNGAFAESGLTDIPGRLFANVRRRSTFIETFARTPARTVPVGLMHGIDPANIDGMFEPVRAADHDPIKIKAGPAFPQDFFDDTRNAVGVATCRQL